MSKFETSTTPLLHSGLGAIKKAGPLLADILGASNILVVTDPGIQKAGLLKGLEESLRTQGCRYSIYDDISPDPLEAEVIEGAKIAADKAVDGVIGIGGGSPMDAAKAISILRQSSKPITDLFGLNRVEDGRLPLMLIPTTAGTGSEATPYAVITRPSGEKKSITDPASYPDVALLDAELTASLPSKLTAATGVDAMVHAIEAYTSKGNKSPESDQLALNAFQALWKGVPLAVNDPSSLENRDRVLLAAFEAGAAIATAPVGGVHALAYPLGGLHHIHHGLSNALMLPPVLRHNAAAAAPLYADLADLVLPGLKGSDEAKTEALIAAIERMIPALGLETKLSQIGLTEDDIPALVEEAMKLDRLLKNNPCEITAADCKNLYLSVF